MEITKTSDHERLYSISEVSRLTGVPAHTIRFWEKDFSQFLMPSRTRGGQRRYRISDIEVIKRISHCRYIERHTIAGTIAVLTDAKNSVDRLNIEAMINEIAQMVKQVIISQCDEMKTFSCAELTSAGKR